MDNARTRQLAWLRDLHSVSIEAQQAWGARLATWLVTGNAAAMVLIFNASISPSAELAPVFEVSLWLFAGGLAAAFIGAVISYLLGTRVTHWVGQTVTSLSSIEMNQEDLRELETEHGALPDDNALNQSIEAHERQLLVSQQRLERLVRFIAATLLIFGMSALLFAAGILWPTVSGWSWIS